MIIIITYCTFHHYTCWPYQPLHTCICQILLIRVHCDCVRIEETFVISFFFSRFIRFCFCVHYSHFRVVFGRLCACDKLSFNVVPIVSANRMHDVFNISFRLLFSINSIFFSSSFFRALCVSLLLFHVRLVVGVVTLHTWAHDTLHAVFLWIFRAANVLWLNVNGKKYSKEELK